MKEKEEFSYTVPWRDTLACWFSALWLFVCTACRLSMRQGQAVGRVFWSSTAVQAVRSWEKLPMRWAGRRVNVARLLVTGIIGILPIYTHAQQDGGAFFTIPNQAVVVECLGKYADYTSFLYFQNPTDNKKLLVCNSAEAGKKVSFESFPKEREVTFSLSVVNSGQTYFTGKPSRNPDGLLHVWAKPADPDQPGVQPGAWDFGFEDQLGGGDKDYNDCLFRVTGLKVSSYPNCGSVSVRVWVDKNGNQRYDLGEEVSGAAVFLNQETTQRGLTDAKGLIQLNLVATDKIYAEKTFFSVDNAKAKDTNFGGKATNNPYAGIDGKAYSFVMASDVMRKSSGEYLDFPATGDVCGDNFKAARDVQGNVLVQLVHPKIEWNLVVAFEDAQIITSNGGINLTDVQTGFTNYANYLYNYTDGYSVVKNVVLVQTNFAGTPQWKWADVRVYNDMHPNACVFAWRDASGCEATWGDNQVDSILAYSIRMSKYWGNVPPTCPSSAPWSKACQDCVPSGQTTCPIPKRRLASNNFTSDRWSSTLGHESGHYLLGFYDEYLSGNSQKVSDGTWTYRINNPNEFPANYGVMDHQFDSHELSDATDYFSRSSYTDEQMTDQYKNREKKSTWNFLRDHYQAEIQTQMSGQGFSPSFFNKLIQPLHTEGSYPGNYDSTKRAGPTQMNHDAIAFSTKSGHRGED